MSKNKNTTSLTKAEDEQAMRREKDKLPAESDPKQYPGPDPKQPSDRQPEREEAPRPPNLAIHQLIWLLITFMLIYFWLDQRPPAQPNVPYSTFKEELRKDNVQKVTLKDNTVLGTFRKPVLLGKEKKVEQQRFRTQMPSFGDPELLTLLERQQVEIEAQSEQFPTWASILLSMAPWLLLLAFLAYSSHVFRSSFEGRGGGPFSFSKSRARQIEARNIDTRFDDIAGLEGAKKDLLEIIDYLKSPEKYHKLGAKMPKGILMMGPPGCGKTLLAKAAAGEAGVPFFSVSGSEFIEMFVGVGASRVRDMFANARKSAPALVFIDEIDSVGRARGTGLGGGNDEREQTLNQILAEMDGFSSTEAIVVLAATNRPDVLDSALLRPGRFDRKLVLELPDRKAREAILRVHARRVPTAEDVDLANIAAITVGFSGADLANLVNEATLRAASRDKATVTAEDFEAARDKVVLGNELGVLLNSSEKERVAYHESGHALIAYYSPCADPLNKITIIPHGRALGATEQLPTEDRHNYTQEYLQERLCIMLGGRCAERIQYGQVSSGAADDLKRATQLARQMVTQWGMSERIGPVNFQQSEEHPFLGREIQEPKSFSEYSAQIVDEEVSLLIKRCESNSMEILRNHKRQLTLLAEALLKKESLDRTEIAQLLG